MEDNNDKLTKPSNTQEETEHPDIPSDIEKLIDYVPVDKKEEALKIIRSLTISKTSSFIGPLPPPAILDEYNTTINNGAERIMKMAENQSSHRIELEKHAIKEELKQSSRGQVYGFILAIIGMCIAFGLAYLGHDTVAGIFGTTTIVGLVTVFVLGRKQQNNDSED